MAFYEVFRNNERFERYYNKKPHLYERHEKDFKENMWDEHLELANSFKPSDYKEWKASLGKLFKYEKELYAKVDRHYNLLIVSYYDLRQDFLFMRFILDTSTSAMYHYRMKAFKQFAYVLNACDGRVQMGGWTDYDRFYTQTQRKLDDKSISILKEMCPQFKYLPIERFNKINIYNLFQVSDDAIYQYEILLKNGLDKLATDLMLNKDFIQKGDFKRFKKEIMGGIRLNKLKELVYSHHEKEREIERRLKQKEQIKLFSKLPKLSFDLGKFILRHPLDVKELEREGRELHHCVANYLDNIVKKNTGVMLLRKKDEPDVPFFTVEIRGNSVTQVRTFKNQTDPEITKIVKGWNKRRMEMT